MSTYSEDPALVARAWRRPSGRKHYSSKPFCQVTDEVVRSAMSRVECTSRPDGQDVGPASKWHNRFGLTSESVVPLFLFQPAGARKVIGIESANFVTNTENQRATGSC